MGRQPGHGVDATRLAAPVLGQQVGGDAVQPRPRRRSFEVVRVALLEGDAEDLADHGLGLVRPEPAHDSGAARWRAGRRSRRTAPGRRATPRSPRRPTRPPQTYLPRSDARVRGCERKAAPQTEKTCGLACADGDGSDGTLERLSGEPFSRRRLIIDVGTPAFSWHWPRIIARYRPLAPRACGSTTRGRRSGTERARKSCGAPRSRRPSSRSAPSCG